MWLKNNVAKHLYKNQGLTLLEVLAVVIILGIVAAIAVPGVLGYIEKTRADVCDVNMKSLERNYEVHLAIESIEHSTVVFSEYFRQYGEEVCPDLGEITYGDGGIRCSVHDHGESDGSEDSGGGVPFL